MKVKFKVFIVLGSETDDKLLAESKMTDVLDSLELPWEVWAASSHRHLDVLVAELHLSKRTSDNAKSIYIAGASMSAALPGVMEAIMLGGWPVIGVALPSPEFPDAMDALLSMVRMPGRMPVAVAGIGKAGFVNAATLAGQLAAFADSDFVTILERIQREAGELKPAKIPLRKSQEKTGGN